MLDDERTTQPAAGAQLLSYVLGELDADSQVALEKRVAAEPALKDELDEIRGHMRLHQDVRKVAPRRGSFERLRGRMKKEGAFEGAIPGVHAMLRRSFLVAMAVGMVAIVLLAAFSRSQTGVAAPDVIGEIIYTSPTVSVGQRRDVVERASLQANRDKPYDTGAYDAFIWLPTGVSNTFSTIEATENTEFQFSTPRRVELVRGNFRRIEVQPGGVGDGPFEVKTPHARVQVEEGSLTVSVARDGSETQISVGRGSARVYGLESERSIPVVAGYCTSVQRGKLPDPSRPVLKLLLARVPGTEYMVSATLVNDGYAPFKVRRAVDSERAFKEPIYLLHVSHASEYEPDTLPENITLPPWQPIPAPDPGVDHTGDMWLNPGEIYRFNFDVSPLLVMTPRVEHWLRLEYRGDLYGPQGEARVRIQSPNLKLDLRSR
ncbi:MAG: FecR domain-containing protein [Planctomycetes bacterium]|nr:FecR domain-containing protein [Planctomycetota bacterium]MCW8137105.1 FecR domain-containing protein [Planctomycetota bacterium]